VPSFRILIAEDEPHLREVLGLQLTAAGFEVIEASDGRAAIEAAHRTTPDLILLDVMMPYMDGFEVCRTLRESFQTRHIPIIMLTAKTEVEDRLDGLKGGANDYITKPWETRELMQRVHNALEWSRQQRAASPLTGLPGNLSIHDEVSRRIASEEPFAQLTIDIDSFKAFNDHYGYARGDDAIRSLAHILLDAVERGGASDDFIGHIGGDDFIVLTRPDRAEPVAERIRTEFDRLTPELYSPEDRARGHIEVLNRRHEAERFPLMSVTIALVSTDRVPVTHQAELNDKAQELKELGKTLPGSVVVTERRTIPDAAPQDDRRVA